MLELRLQVKEFSNNLIKCIDSSINISNQQQKRIDDLSRVLEELINATEYGVNQWQQAFHPEAETNGQKVIRKAKQALQRDKELQDG